MVVLGERGLSRRNPDSGDRKRDLATARRALSVIGALNFPVDDYLWEYQVEAYEGRVRLYPNPTAETSKSAPFETSRFTVTFDGNLHKSSIPVYRVDYIRRSEGAHPKTVWVMSNRSRSSRDKLFWEHIVTSGFADVKCLAITFDEQTLNHVALFIGEKHTWLSDLPIDEHEEHRLFKLGYNNVHGGRGAVNYALHEVEQALDVPRGTMPLVGEFSANKLIRACIAADTLTPTVFAQADK